MELTQNMNFFSNLTPNRGNNFNEYRHIFVNLSRIYFNLFSFLYKDNLVNSITKKGYYINVHKSHTINN